MMTSAEDSYPLWGIESYFQELSTFVASLGHDRISFSNERYTEYVLDRLATCITTLSRLSDHIQSGIESTELDEDETEAIDQYQIHLSQLTQCLQDISREWQVHFDLLQRQAGTCRETAFRPSTSNASHRPGRPRFEITREQLEYLSSMSFSWSHIAELLGVSRMTIYRRRVEFGLLDNPTTPISDSDLITTVSTIRIEFPEMGETMVWGQLRSQGINVTRERVRATLRQTDTSANRPTEYKFKMAGKSDPEKTILRPWT